MNIQSSRSHALLCVAVKGENKVTGVVTLGMNALYVCAQMNYRRLRLFCHKKLSVLQNKWSIVTSLHYTATRSVKLQTWLCCGMTNSFARGETMFWCCILHLNYG